MAIKEKCLRCDVDLCTEEDLKTGICSDCWTPKDGEV